MHSAVLAVTAPRRHRSTEIRHLGRDAAPLARTDRASGDRQGGERIDRVRGAALSLDDAPAVCGGDGLRRRGRVVPNSVVLGCVRFCLSDSARWRCGRRDMLARRARKNARANW